MLIQIPQTGVIQKQTFDIKQEVSIIYGYNNCGKTTLLRALNQAFHSQLMERFIQGQEGEVAIYIPTNRVVVSGSNTDELRLKDYEEFVHYQKDSLKDYSLHLKQLRDQLFRNQAIHQFICSAVRRIFAVDIQEIHGRYSDGIENIINIYLNVIWAMTWDQDISGLTEEGLDKLLSEKQIDVMIDEIEMFLHVNVQAELISSMKKDFAGCRFILTTHSPLLLTRYPKCAIYNIQKGLLEEMKKDMYYEDLDLTYEGLFQVDVFPEGARKDINYLGNAVLNRKDSSWEDIQKAADRLWENYPNIYRRYNKMITKAISIGEPNDSHQENQDAKGAGRNQP